MTAIDPRLSRFAIDIETARLIDSLIADECESRSRARVLEYLATGWIPDEMAMRILNELDRAV